MHTTGETCTENVSGKSIWDRAHPCENKIKVERDGRGYCGIHDPEYVKKRQKKQYDKDHANDCKKCKRTGHSWYKYCPFCGIKK